ncbi:UDP-N-acetylmuramate--L-alanine ligase [Sulfidibacter corallicola]|uniref:UDP-N-acetylmuramate--L-alanine ligase n=1 Tax=Sulfidibacter corallicola TaxID=2818388 RepID=A0A8A4TGW8_SULCO|nr:UDP-N-acetylmuramate--L-alanine ligase [Sulfidibacter corallicola]QTD48041.1 UDP-N-acetylmuramate--L-alanine ligase [Sulfidibacter corallicola]
MFRKIKAIHFVGIGGSGMSGIAEILLTSGYTVSGSDIRESKTTNRLRDLGAEIFIGHDPQNIIGSEVIVVSSAIKNDNPELIAAQYRNIPIIPRAEMLAEIMRMKYGIAVAGAHGKTTTTSMLAHVLSDSELDPTVVIGGRLNKFDSNARLGKGQLILAEADESDGSFMRLSPTISIVTNLDEEHLEHYTGGIDQISETFLAFMNKVPFYGLVIACIDDDRLAGLLQRVTRPLLTYGLKGHADLSAANIKAEGFNMTYELMVRGANLGRIELSVPGLHNVANSLAAIAVGLELDVPIHSIRASLKKFTGADRRFYRLGEVRERLMLDDYAHHPTEITATLAAARAGFEGRVVAIFQPHRYSRLRDLWDRFLACFQEADHVAVLPVFPAGEAPVPGIDAGRFASELAQKHHSVSFLDDPENLADHLMEHSSKGDMILGLGAGSISLMTRKLYNQWHAEEAAGKTTQPQ